MDTRVGTIVLHATLAARAHQEMYTYTIGYCGYEGGQKVVLVHERKFSQEEWERIVTDAIAEAAKKHVRVGTEYRRGEFGSPAHHLKNALKWRRRGNERMYDYYVVKALDAAGEFGGLTVQFDEVFDSFAAELAKRDFKEITTLFKDSGLSAYGFESDNLAVDTESDGADRQPRDDLENKMSAAVRSAVGDATGCEERKQIAEKEREARRAADSLSLDEEDRKLFSRFSVEYQPPPNP
jgi:hypothetical protein